MFVNILEEDFESIIDEAFEEGYAQAYSEIKKSDQNLNYRMGFNGGYESGYKDAYEEICCPNNERERALQEQAYDDGFKKGKEFNKDDQNLNYRTGYNDGWHDCEASFELGNEFTDSIQEQAFDEGYDQAIDDLIESGVIGEEEYLDEDCSEDDYSEYEFGDVDDDEEEYCFYKEIERVLNSESASNIKSDKKTGEDLEEYKQGYEDGKSRGITLGYNKRDYEYSKPNNSDEDCSDEEYCFFKELERVLNGSFVLDSNYNVNSKECSKGGYKLVGISGLARSGKDVAGEIILENLGEGWARGAFADIPKEMLFVMGVDTKCSNKDGEDEYYQYNIRHLMQTLGTDWGRNIDKDIWIKAFKKKNPTGNFVITDVRMENEADFVRDNGGVIIHIKGRGGIKGNHQSEAGIEIKRGDLLVFNDSDLVNFEKEINNICKTLVKRV